MHAIRLPRMRGPDPDTETGGLLGRLVSRARASSPGQASTLTGKSGSRQAGSWEEQVDHADE